MIHKKGEIFPITLNYKIVDMVSLEDHIYYILEAMKDSRTKHAKYLPFLILASDGETTEIPEEIQLKVLAKRIKRG